MPKTLAVVCADTHVQDRAWSRRPIVGDSYFSLRQIFSYAIKHEIKCIIGAGDLIDKHRNDSEPVVKFYEQLDRLKAVGGEFRYIQGQHEMADPPWLSGHPAAVHVHEHPWTLGGFSVVGLDYQPAGLLQTALDRVTATRPDILIAHQVWSEYMGDIAHPQGSFADVPCVKLMFTGDYHGAYSDKVYRGKDGQELRVVNPGSTCLQSIDEPDAKFFCVLRDDGTIGRVQLFTRKRIDWAVMTTDDDVELFMSRIVERLDAVAAEVAGYPAEVRMPVVRVTYSHRLHDTAARVTEAIGTRAHLFFKELPPVSEVVAARRTVRQAGGAATTLVSHLEAYLEQAGRPDLLTPCQRVLASEDISRELQKMRQEVLSV